MKPSAPRLLFIELNEFNRALLTKAADELKLSAIQELLRMNSSQTITEDTLESDFLEPWSQWVSVHTGQPARVHQTKHLGDVADLKFPQLWETLSEHGISSGVFGALNARRGEAKACKFFVPDPWTFSEEAYPENLNRLIGVPRYAARNYMSISYWELFRRAWEFGLALCNWRAVRKIAPQLLPTLAMFLRYPSAFAPFCLAEYALCQLFINARKKYRPQFSVFFINSIAHLQHYYWKSEELGARLSFGFRMVDRMIGDLIAARGKDEAILVCNALSQSNTEAEAPWISYRPIQHETFLSAIEVPFTSVQPLMSYDSHVFFRDADDCRVGKRRLEAVTIRDQKMFLVETYPDNPRKLFFRFQFTDPVDAHTTFSCEGKSHSFHQYFKAIVTRTGKHSAHGTVFADGISLPAKLANHEIGDFCLRYFKVPEAAIRNRAAA